jgi:uncharacterized cysteine cluster protein YcgN (CxxCxxCC family)
LIVLIANAHHSTSRHPFRQRLANNAIDVSTWSSQCNRAGDCEAMS